MPKARFDALAYCCCAQAEAAAAAAKAQLPADLAEIAKTQGLRSTAFQAYLRLQVRGVNADRAPQGLGCTGF